MDLYLSGYCNAWSASTGTWCVSAVLADGHLAAMDTHRYGQFSEFMEQARPHRDANSGWGLCCSARVK